MKIKKKNNQEVYIILLKIYIIKLNLIKIKKKTLLNKIYKNFKIMFLLKK